MAKKKNPNPSLAEKIIGQKIIDVGNETGKELTIFLGNGIIISVKGEQISFKTEAKE